MTPALEIRQLSAGYHESVVVRGLDLSVGRAAHEADRRLALALGHLENLSAPTGTTSDLAALARYVVERDR